MLKTRGNKSNSRADVAGHGPDLCGQPLHSPWEAVGIAFLKHELQHRPAVVNAEHEKCVEPYEATKIRFITTSGENIEAWL